jgi:hypothetical protein
MEIETKNLFQVTEIKIQKKIAEALQTTKQIVLFVMNNASQLKKLKMIVSGLIRDKEFPEKVFMLSDEGDITIKDGNVTEINKEQSESHKEWIEIEKVLNASGVEYKRTFITATPEACVYMYPVENILELEIPESYSGYEKIRSYAIPEKFSETDSGIIKILEIEIEKRIKNELEKGIILISTERKITAGQNGLFEKIIESDACKDTMVSIYNGEGITVRPTEMLFDRTLSNFVTKYNKINKPKIVVESEDDIFKIQNMTISDFYKVANDSGHLSVVTIGMDLMSRGMSFVSTKDDTSKQPLAATTMIYIPGKTMHLVGLAQSIGRICGTARPDISRRLYTTESVIENYKVFNENQKQYLEKLRNSPGEKSDEIIKNMEFKKKPSRNIDRANLKMNLNYSESEESSSSGSEDYGEIDGVKLTSLRRWLDDDSLVGKMIRFLYDANSGVTFEDFKTGVEYEGSDEQFRNNVANGKGPKAQYGKLWTYRANICKINPKIKEYIE